MTGRGGGRAEAPGHPKKSTTFKNKLHDGASIGTQVGVQNVDNRVFYGGHGPPPQQFDAGVQNLQGGLARPAERLMKTALQQGLKRTNQVHFYYALALLSGRSISQALHDVYDELLPILHAETIGRPDKHSAGLAAIRQLFMALLSQDHIYGQPSADPIVNAMREFDGLKPEIQRLIRRHLELVLTGALEEQLQMSENSEIEQHRCGRDRRRRAGKFFEPDPAPPCRWQVTQSRLPPSTITAGVFSTLFTLIGLFLVVAELESAAAPSGWAVVAAGVATGAAAVWGFVEVTRIHVWRRRQQERHEYQSTYWTDPRQPDDPREDVEWFSDFLYESYAQAFASARPNDPKEGESWDHWTRGLRFFYLNETIWAYSEQWFGNPERLMWLSIHHAWETRRRWDSGLFDDWKRAPAARPVARLALYGGATAFALCVVILVSLGLVSESLSPLGVILLLLGIGLAVRTTRHQDRRPVADHLIRHLEQQQRDQQWQSEAAAYQTKVDYLSDRPTDLEMAEWLDYDTRFIKQESMKKHGLSSRDVINHLVLTEAADGCLRARVPGGPARYSKYVVKLFLLSENGVRELSVDLDFVTATLGHEERLNFRYDALASVTVSEVGVRFAGRKRVVSSLNATQIEAEDPGDSMVFSQSFRITLMGGTSTDVLIENYKLWEGEIEKEDGALLVEMALETSGISTALRILEAVAADGRDWIEHERQRNQRILDRHHDHRPPLALTDGAVATRSTRPPSLEAAPEYFR